MELLSEDDRNLKEMTPEELDRAWDLWFDHGFRTSRDLRRSTRDLGDSTRDREHPGTDL